MADFARVLRSSFRATCTTSKNRFPGGREGVKHKYVLKSVPRPYELSVYSYGLGFDRGDVRCHLERSKAQDCISSTEICSRFDRDYGRFST